MKFDIQPWFGMGAAMMIFFWGIGLVVLVLLIRWALGEKTPNTNSAKEILDKRFAKGEIDEEEYRKRRSMIDE